ncbi:MAG TPA: hypothetical protein DCL77_04290 [Prolixibacteraceae bacterium]|jgi:hypothetical protein|nr:hypothetical protein [Prolixibacteraceae bacterium]
MKKLLLIFLFFVSLATAKAQDKIITIKQDTIECRIISVNAERIIYEQKTSDNHFVGMSIPISDVLQYIRTGRSDSFGDRLVHEKIKRERPEHRWLFSLQGGLAHSFTDYSNFKTMMLDAGNSASITNDYITKLQNGTHLSTSLHYLVTSFFGLGVDYNLFRSASKGEFLSPGYGQLNVPLYLKLGLDERQYSHFAGASVLFQQFPDKKRRIKISETISPGIVLFRNESRNSEYQSYWGDRDFYNGQPPQYYERANSVTSSTNFGAKGSLSVEYGITPQLSAGLAGNFMWAKLHKVSVKNAASDTNDQKLEKPMNISHIDYGFIVRYNF